MSDDRTAALAAALQREARTLDELMAWARRRGITGAEAQRFLARQRASLRRQRQASTPVPAQRTGRTRSVLACCGQWWCIQTLPLYVPCCQRLYLQEDA